MPERVQPFLLKKRMVIIALLWVASVLLAACGTSPAGEGGEQGESSGPKTAVRTIQHTYGDVEIPAEPQRIVVLDNGALDNLLALGVKPVGAPSIVSVEAGFSGYLKGTDGIENIGTVDQPNLEAVSALQPDLIIGNKDRHEAVYDKLVQIAPSVFIEKGADRWKDNLLLHAEAVNKREQGEQLLAQYEERLKQFKEAMGPRLEQMEVSLLRPRQDRVAVYLTESFSGTIVQDMGLKRPEAQRGEGFTINVTEEQVAALDADAVIWFGRENELEFFQNKIQRNPVWSTLKAVENKQIFQVDWETWLSGSGIQSVNLIIDDLFRIFVK